ncbi:MAG: DUF6524 family protein [Pseudomonadota bacterium]
MGRAFLIRWLAALVLVLFTFNPTQMNFVRWAERSWDTQTPIVALVGLVLLVGYIIYFRATFRSIGFAGIALVIALFAALLWVLWDAGIISFENPTLLTWVGLIALSLIMGVGLSWSIIRRRLSGQLDVDDVEASGE